MDIQPYKSEHLAAIVELSLRAWEPVFPSIEAATDPAVYRAFYPNGWRVAQQESVEATCEDETTSVWVAMVDGRLAGFVALKQHDATLGEIYMIAVDPDFQRRGIAGALTDHATEWMRRGGMSVAMVETGADPGHAPARRTYESKGFGLLTAARYFKRL